MKKENASMISKEQIAHDLAVVYMKNRHGINVTGDFYSGSGTIQTEHFHDVSEPEYTKVKTGEKGLFGLERKQKVPSGNKVDPLFAEMIQNYYDAYFRFYQLLCERDVETAESMD